MGQKWRPMPKSLHDLPPFAGSHKINVIIETVRGSGSKFKYDPELGLFLLHRSLPKGHVFPYDYGFVPSTLGQDGDAVDALVLIDTDAFPGCLVRARLIGVIEATQERGRNDCLIAVHEESATWSDVSDIKELPAGLIDQIEYFFDSYRDFQGKNFRAIGRKGPKQAEKLVQAGARKYQKSLSSNG